MEVVFSALDPGVGAGGSSRDPYRLLHLQTWDKEVVGDGLEDQHEALQGLHYHRGQRRNYRGCSHNWIGGW